MRDPQSIGLDAPHPDVSGVRRGRNLPRGGKPVKRFAEGVWSRLVAECEPLVAALKPLQYCSAA
jgi:hypothetical protein